MRFRYIAIASILMILGACSREGLSEADKRFIKHVINEYYTFFGQRTKKTYADFREFFGKYFCKNYIEYYAYLSEKNKLTTDNINNPLLWKEFSKIDKQKRFMFFIRFTTFSWYRIKRLEVKEVLIKSINTKGKVIIAKIYERLQNESGITFDDVNIFYFKRIKGRLCLFDIYKKGELL